MSRLRFKKLWLVSEATRAAQLITFHSERTLLVGKNHTGKSTIVKNIFRTLGCETKGKSDRWDNNAISVLQFELNEKQYTVLRRANVYALRDDENTNVRVTASYSEWSEIIAEIFDFRLILSDHQDNAKQATPPYLFLPYYMDQDGSWTHQWNSFEKLSQFADWKKSLVAYVTGQKPNGYYLAKVEESKAKASLKLFNQELGVVKSALARVRKTLPQHSVSLDTAVFKKEINDLLRISTQLKTEQESLRRKAFDYASEKESLASQIAIARATLKDLEGDLKYLTESNTEEEITCPTCGTTHESGFSVRLELVEDKVTVRTVLSDLNEAHRNCEAKLAELHGKISRIRLREQEIEKILQSKKGKLRLQDLVDSQSANVIRSAFAKDIDSLRRQMDAEEKVAADAKLRVRQFDLPEHTKSINDFYAERMELFASELGVYDLRDDIKARPNAKISLSGSALPRSLLAFSFAVLHTAKENADAKRFPIVIDSPNQQGQDTEHLKQMLKFILKRTPNEQQLILAVEEIPSGLAFDGEIVELNVPFGLLETDRYDQACDELHDLRMAFEIGLDQYLANRRNAPEYVTDDADAF